jgi:hypothetical protein
MQERSKRFGALLVDTWRDFWQQATIQMPFFRALLALLLSIDLALILIHVLYMTGVIVTRLYSIENDQGYAEFYQAIKQGWLALIMFLYALQSANLRYLAWSAIFCYILLDDFLMVHERVGEAIVETWQIEDQLGLRGQDIGELMVFGVAGLLLLPLLAVALYSGDQRFRRDSLLLIAGFVLYAGFAIGVDIVHIFFLETSLSSFFGLLEDGGELMLVSFLLWIGFLMLARQGLAPLPPSPLYTQQNPKNQG